MSVKVGDKVKFTGFSLLLRKGAKGTVKHVHNYDEITAEFNGSPVVVSENEIEIITNEADDNMNGEKEQVGDLIRIVNTTSKIIKNGEIYEVVGTAGIDGVWVKFADGEGFVRNDEYVIHRKAGEEDSDVDSTQEPEGTYRIVYGVIVTDETEQAARIRQACTELSDLLVRKNHDYGDSFSQQYAKYGLMSALIRMDDKMRRLETLQAGEQAQVSESVNDTLLDLAGYALLVYVEQSKK